MTMASRVGENSGLNVEGDEQRANGDSSASTARTCAHHRRSRSFIAFPFWLRFLLSISDFVLGSFNASEKSLNLPRVEHTYCTRTDQDESSELVPSTSSCTGTPVQKSSFSSTKDAISSHRASLEKDIEQLQSHLQQERTMRGVLEQAMGRASSTLSPGHRHFAAQTKELIAEIELLEEEVANREQHVLSLYRSIFENCVSWQSSQHNSLVTSPAHVRSEQRKHPSVISSAFCSSKNFTLRKLNALATASDSTKRSSSQSKPRNASLVNGKNNVYFEKSSMNNVKGPIGRKNSVPRTLKDHIHQCPSNLAEEMVRCMATIYCWLRSTSSSSSAEKEENLSTSSIIPRWSTKLTVEIPWISKDKNNFSRASYAINNYRVLVEQLEKVNVRKMDADARLAFWINLYNSLIMHAYLAFGIPRNSLRRLALFHKAAYNVGGHVISANSIEQSIFGYRTPRMGQWLETVLSTAMRKRSEERKVIGTKYGLEDFQPLVCFALCTGAHSDPMLNVYTAGNIKEELEAAKREFLQANTVIKKLKKILLPKLIDKYAKEASIPYDSIIKWIAENVDDKLNDALRKCQPSKRASQNIKWLPYNSRFRYVFSKELTQKPWWL